MRLITALAFAGVALLALSGSACNGDKSEPGRGGGASQDAENTPSTPLPCTPHRDEEPQAGRIAAGTYCVCSEGPPGDMDHDAMNARGRHLKNGDPLVIGPSKEERAVTLATNKLAFADLDGAGLTALLGYPHTEGTASGKRIVHLVNVAPYKGSPDAQLGSCNLETGNVVRIEFCYWGGESDPQWKCPSTTNMPGAHKGDIHAEN